jgi:hypothetical protein
MIRIKTDNGKRLKELGVSVHYFTKAELDDEEFAILSSQASCELMKAMVETDYNDIGEAFLKARDILDSDGKKIFDTLCNKVDAIRTQGLDKILDFVRGKINPKKPVIIDNDDDEELEEEDDENHCPDVEDEVDNYIEEEVRDGGYSYSDGENDRDEEVIGQHPWEMD